MKTKKTYQTPALELKQMMIVDVLGASNPDNFLNDGTDNIFERGAV